MFETMVDILNERGRRQRGETAFAFMANGEDETDSLTFDQLDAEAAAIAAHLLSFARPGDRALLLYSPGLAFVKAFFGCLYAGIIAVPASLPRRRRFLEKVLGIVRDCQPRLVLTESELADELAPLSVGLPGVGSIKTIATDALSLEEREHAAGHWTRPEIDRSSIAFLQYTSGSTGDPKGVCVSHWNLIYNSLMINEAFGHDHTTRMVGWLPLFHDMGLVGGIVQPVYNGIFSALMPPVSFIQKPARWLRAISKYRATTSGGPNFGYDLCAQKVRPEEMEGVDLGSWTVAFNGAEPVRADTVRRFAETFAPYGFKAAAHHPCYGMAETTLIVSGGDIREQPRVLRLSASSLEKGTAAVAPPEAMGSREVRELVACGATIKDSVIKIVDPEKLVECVSGQVGEIWVRGENVSTGYWGRPDLNREVFGVRIAGTGEGPFLRTGDLGFMHGSRLYISGRRKDTIIIRGRNLYPQDIELAVERSHPGMQPGGGAAFAIEGDAEDRLVVVHELRREAQRRVGDHDQIMAAARAAVVRDFDVMVSDVVLIDLGKLSRTSSGKTMRTHCKNLYLAGTLNRSGAAAPRSGDSPVSDESGAVG